MPKMINLTGQRFNRLVVLERDIETQLLKNSKDAFWKCQCDCGNVVSVRGHDLRQNKIQSCGCLRKENTKSINYKDLKGQKFGKLTVLYMCDYQIDKHSVWHCKCECGNEKDIMGKHLLSGATQSCGCLKSSGELKLITVLKQMNIEFETQKTFDSCKNVLPLYFDFYIPRYNMVIEYNGIQHYESIKFFGGEQRLEEQKQNDLIKRQWCKEHQIKFVEISYLEQNRINEEYIKKILGEK